MLTCIYVVEKIDGDYAELRRVDALKHDPEETKTVARALLPGDIIDRKSTRLNSSHSV